LLAGEGGESPRGVSKQGVQGAGTGGSSGREGVPSTCYQEQERVVLEETATVMRKLVDNMRKRMLVTATGWAPPAPSPTSQSPGGVQRGPGGLQRGPEGFLRGSEGLQRSSEGSQRGPEGMQRGAEGMQRGPEGLQRGPEGLQRGPEGSQRGPEGLQRSPEGLQRGPEGMQRGGFGGDGASNGNGEGLADGVEVRGVGGAKATARPDDGLSNAAGGGVSSPQ
jgi:hypothetical protein